ncbi:hypothetical protein RI129_005172 [Pyrocoelia pectoralis]|uniref:Uncharacterized protein n=1 Tax=Pyrocoelia pectoralis TaxID=417401 RepID=A0AAN7VJ84_9COLE
MGVTGLWRLIEPSGHPVPLQTLNNKVLAVDVSIWLHQAIKGFQNAQGGTLPNAHLLGIYHRICKLLFFGIKPVVIFDGGVPSLKQETIYKRASKRTKNLNEADSLHKQLVSALLKHTAISKILSEESIVNLAIKPVKEKAEDIYKLPPTDFDSTLSDEETSTSIESSPTKQWDLHTIDEKSSHFKSLPADVRHDILTDLKETRKQSSWGKIHEMPKKSDDFSGFQMKRLLKRYSVQVSLEEAEKEMGGRSLSLAELETLLNDQGVITCDSVGKHIASDENKRYLLIKDLKKAIDDAKQNVQVKDLENIPEEVQNEQTTDNKSEEIVNHSENAVTTNNKADEEFEGDLQLAIQLSLQDIPSTSQECKRPTTKKRNNFSFLQDFDDADFPSSSESEEDCTKSSNRNKVLESVKNYMVEYSGLTPNEVAKIMGGSVKTKPISNDCTKLKDVATLISEKSELSTTVHHELEIKTTASDAKEINEPKAKDICDKENETNSKSVDNNLTSKTDSIEINSKGELSNACVANESFDDSSNEFIEVLEEPKPVSKEVNVNTLEIVIKPGESVEDDLFGDVFSTNEKHKITSKINPLNVPERINLKKLGIESRTSKVSLSTSTPVPDDCERHTNDIPVEEQLVDTKESTNNTGTSQTSEMREPITRQQLREIQQDLEDKNVELLTEQLTKERMANSLSEQIVQETQDLLRLFGVPYIVAPMEAEAQCAFLEIINLTDGTITDDSDIWLFGGKTVYKNFFNQQKHVMEFRAERIQEHYKLSREQMILLALLVGSDYTIGIQGIGPVTALEVLGAFPHPKKLPENSYNYQQLASGLEEFRKWLSGEKNVGLGRTGLRTKLKNVAINAGFPNVNVIKAYLEPNVDSSSEKFFWGIPDKQGLVEYAKKKFGWPLEKSETILKPVLKKQNETQSQKSIKDYFKTKHKIGGGDIENKMSKRVKKAVDTIDNGLNNSENKVNTGKASCTKRGKQKCKQNNPVNENCQLSSDEDIQVLRKAKIHTKTKLKQIREDIEKQVENVKVPRPMTKLQLHKKEVIPQKQKEKAAALRSKIKAIEIFRKSKKGPGYVEPRKCKKRLPKDEAELSESSSD